MNAKARPYDDAAYSQLKAATRRAVELGGPLCQIAKHTRLDVGTISRAGNNAEGNFIPIDVAIDLDALAGDDVILRAMARLRGYDLVPVSTRKKFIDLVGDAGSVAKESGELVSETIKAVGSGDLTPAKARRIDDEAADVEAVIADMRQRVHGVMAAK